MTAQDDDYRQKYRDHQTSLLFGCLKHPYYLTEGPSQPTALDWLKAKTIDDNIANNSKSAETTSKVQSKQLWRIHEKLYDFSEFIDKHPGGRSFIEMTQGHDITELFESSHVNIDATRLIASKYYISDCESIRNNNVFTFHEDGFYSKLRSRAWRVLKQTGTGPTPHMLLIHDSLLATFLILMLLLTGMPQSVFWLDDYWYVSMCLAGVTLALLSICSHNFFHQRDSWRIHSFDMCLHSSHDWRISHVYSHHCFPNTLLDYEMMAFQPFMRFLPHPGKTLVECLLRVVLNPTLVFAFPLVLVFLKRIASILLFKTKFRLEYMLPVALLSSCVGLRVISITLFTAWTSASIHEAILTVAYRCVLMYVVNSLVFLHIGLAAGHHHPKIWHAGDLIPVDSLSGPMKHVRGVGDSLDWGLFQLISVGSRPQLDESLLLSSVSFGMHTLHHLFPTVDQSKLHLLVPVLKQTCEEYHLSLPTDSSVDVSVLESNWSRQRRFSVLDGWLGMFQQSCNSTFSCDNFPVIKSTTEH